MPSAWLRNGPTHRNCSAPTLLLLRKTRRSLAEGTSRQKPPSAPSALPANRHPTGGQTCRPSTGTPGRSPPAWGKLRTRNDGAATALYPLSAPGGGEGWGEVGDSRTLADTHLTLPSLRDGPLPLRPEGRRGDLWPPQTGLELRTGWGVWVRVCVAAIETISTVSSYNE